MKYSWVDVGNHDRDTWKAICPENEYRIIGQTGFQSGLLPNGLVKKAISIIVMSSGCPSGEAYYMAYVNRFDKKAGAIDGEPFALGFVGDNPLSSGFFAHHGNWHNRTTILPQDIWSNLQESDIGVIHGLLNLPDSTAGSLSDLQEWDGRPLFSDFIQKLKDKHTND